MLKKLKACCGCGSNDVVVPERTTVSKSPAISEAMSDSYINEQEMQESGLIVDPMNNIGSYELNPAYMSAQTAPPLNTTIQPKNSEDDSGVSEPLNL